MLKRLFRTWRLPRAATGLVLLGAFVAAAPAAASAATVTVTGSSVIVSGQPFGNATVTASRPDAVTGKPVVIGSFSGMAFPGTPFTVNTTAPGAGGSGGDCWQKGALASALTPDLLPGDTVTVAGSGFFGSPGPSTSVVVGSDGQGKTGPIPPCAPSAPFAHNAITSAPTSVSGDSPITVSGVAQPNATGVSITAGDGTATTPAVSTTPGADGTWSATIPSRDVASLADGPLTVTPTFTVPDVATGATAHIAAAKATVTKGTDNRASSSASDGAGAAGQEAGQAGGMPAGTTGTGRLMGVRAPGRMSLRTARTKGIAISLVVPAAATRVKVQLLRAHAKPYTKIVGAGRTGSRQTVVLRALSLRRSLRPGMYRVTVGAGNASGFGVPVERMLRIV